MSLSLQSLRLALLKHATRRATALESKRPKAAERWMRIACRVAPKFDFVHRDLVAHLRRSDNRLGAVKAAEDAIRRFGDSPDAWMLLGECYVAAYKPRDAVAAFENVLVIEERAAAAMAAGELYSRLGDHITAGARYARAYAAGAGPDALKLNALELRAAGDAKAAAEARMLWEKETGRKWDDFHPAGG